MRALGRCPEEEIWSAGVRFAAPLSPHLAASREGTTIRSGELLAALPNATDDRAWIVEGAGGVLVPIHQEMFMIDLISILRLPVVVVARTQLGTINHTLLTLEALRSRAIRVGGVVVVGQPNRENADSIEQFGAVEILGELPLLTDLNAESLAAWSCAHFDTEGTLETLLSEAAQ